MARRLLRQAGFAVPQADQAHASLWLRLANSGHPDVQQAGRDLHYLRGRRNWADYDLDQPFAQTLALDNVLAASTIIQLLQAAATRPLVLGAITDAIRIYERDVLGQVTWQP